MIKDIIKYVSSAVVGTGVGFVVRSIIKNNTTTPKGIIGKVLMGVGGIAISGYISRKVQQEFREQVDYTFDEIEKVNIDQEI